MVGKGTSKRAGKSLKGELTASFAHVLHRLFHVGWHPKYWDSVCSFVCVCVCVFGREEMHVCVYVHAYVYTCVVYVQSFLLCGVWCVVCGVCSYNRAGRPVHITILLLCTYT
jgi:hypothetical protein